LQVTEVAHDAIHEIWKESFSLTCAPEVRK